MLACGTATAGPALANSSGDGRSERVGVEWSKYQRRHAAGAIATVDGTNLVVTQRDGSPLTVTTSDTTTITSTTVAALADIATGSFVNVRARTADDGTLVAKRINIRPAPAATADTTSAWAGWRSWRHGVAGVVESYDPATGVITITTDEGPISVTAGETTKVTETVVLTVAGLTVGANVKLKGSTSDDGTFAASRIQVLAAATTEPPPTIESPTTAPPTTEAPPTTDGSSGDSGDAGEDEDDVSPSNSRYHGTVQSVDGVTFTLTLRDGTVVTVVTNDATEYRNKLTRGDDGGTPASIADVTVGAWVKVKGTLDGTTLLAEKVTVGPHFGDDGDGRGSDDGNRWDGESRGQKPKNGSWSDEGDAQEVRPTSDRGGDRGYSRPSDDRASQSRGGSARR